MVKDPQSIYAPGRRGLGWLKMKKALATIDCVVVGVEVGHGKRHGVLSDYTFAVRDTDTGKLVNIGKAYSGLTDAEIAEMTGWFEAHTIARFGRYHQVEPTVVVEIAFDVIVRSKRHGSGFSLRFPRIVAAAARQDGRRDRHGRDASPRCTRGSSTARSIWSRRGPGQSRRRHGRTSAPARWDRLSDRPAGPADCPIRPSRRRRPRRPRGRAASARTPAWRPRPPIRRSRPSGGRATTFARWSRSRSSAPSRSRWRPGWLVAPTGTLTAPGMCPRRFVLPS